MAHSHNSQLWLRWEGKGGREPQQGEDLRHDLKEQKQTPQFEQALFQPGEIPRENVEELDIWLTKCQWNPVVQFRRYENS